MAVNGCKWLELAGSDWNGWKLLEMAENCLKLMEWLGIARIGWKWQEITGNG